MGVYPEARGKFPTNGHAYGFNGRMHKCQQPSVTDYTGAGKYSDTGNRTPGYRVRGDNVSHYTISDVRQMCYAASGLVALGTVTV